MASKNIQLKLYKIDKSLFPDIPVLSIPTQIITNANKTEENAERHFTQQKLQDSLEIPEGFSFTVYHAIKGNKPGWVGAWEEVLEKDSDMIGRNNLMSSFIAFITSGENIYALTGGLGNNTIQRYVENFFGLDVIDRLLDSTQFRGIGEASKSGVTGNVKSELRTFYDLTDGFSQDSFETFFRQLKSKIDSSVAKEYFEDFYPKKDFNSFFQGGNYFLIRKSLSIKRIFELIASVERIFEQRESSGHNKLIPIGAVNSSKVHRVKTLNESLVQDLHSNQENPDALNNYYFAPKDIPEYQIDGAIFAIAERANHISDSSTYEEMPKVSDYVNVLLEAIPAAKFQNPEDFKDAFNSYKLYWKHAEEERFSLMDAFDSLNGVLEVEGKSYLRFESYWYEARSNFKEIIDNEFSELVSNQKKVMGSQSYLAAWNDGTEDDYNFSYLKNEFILVTHRVMKPDSKLSAMDPHIEYADLIHTDPEEPKFIHVKKKCNGEMRVASAQVVICAQKINQGDLDPFLREYYGRIMSQAPHNQQKNKISEDDFVKLGTSDNLRICLVLSDPRVLANDPNLSLCGKFYFVKMFKDLDRLGYGERFAVICV